MDQRSTLLRSFAHGPLNSHELIESLAPSEFEGAQVRGQEPLRDPLANRPLPEVHRQIDFLGDRAHENAVDRSSSVKAAIWHGWHASGA